MNGESSKPTRRHFLQNSAVSATGAVLGVNAFAAADVASAPTAKASRTLISRPATITVVSYPPLPKDEPERLNKTLRRMTDYIDQAAQLGSDLVAFPEICNHYGESPEWVFESLDGPTVTALSRKAAGKNIYVVCPLATIENGTRYNASVLLGRDGKIVGVYHKNFPTHAELDIGIIPGTETPVFKTDFGRVGLTVCFDLNYWEVGSAYCTNQAELVIWSSMWDGARMLTRWAIEFGFYMAATCSKCSTIVDVCGREIKSASRNVYDRTDGAGSPLVTARIDMDRRLLHHDFNLARLKPIYEKYGADSISAEWLPQECLLVFGSQMPGVASDELIEEFQLETMRHYLARVRRDRKGALEGTYKATTQS
jgi:beta-ureidopropionase